jgi:predicted CXXCH cytochrome family protein
MRQLPHRKIAGTPAGLKTRFPILVTIGILVLHIMAGPAESYAQDKLKPGAKGGVCLECHDKFKDTLKHKYVHPLMKAGECTGCHTPHTSSSKGLLNADLTSLCKDCHKGLLPENAKSVHRLAIEGKCTTCHDPHGSENKSILIKSDNELCYNCHGEIREKMINAQYKHTPVEKETGCLNCHNPHSSSVSDSLLKKDTVSLCLDCHKADPSFKAKHMNFNVTGTDCVSCHDPHGSGRKGLLYDDTHAPVGEGKCMECHTDPSNPKAFKNGVNGADLCRLCHQQMIDNVLSKNRVHWSLFSRSSCMNCHNPHASREKRLLSGPVSSVCGKCHSDTVSLQSVSRDNPENKKLCEPVKTGNCISCHSPHSADNILLMESGKISDICGKCHEWQTHSSHPIGEKVVDQRNRNLTLDCLSCHRACGTGNNPTMLHFPTTYETCIECHAERRR